MDLVNYLGDMREEARKGRADRQKLNERNWDAFFNKQDWSHKIEGQSKEFIPKVSVTAQQFKAFIKRALVQFGPYFSITTPEDAPIDGNAIRNWLMDEFTRLAGDDGEDTALASIIGDGTIVGLLESVMWLKVLPVQTRKQHFQVNRGDSEPTPKEIKPTQLKVTLCRSEDIFEDPNGRGLYRIHRVETDLEEIIRKVKDDDNPQGIYDPDVVADLVLDYEDPEIEKEWRKRLLNQDNTPPRHRKRTVIEEYYGTLFENDGTVKEGNHKVMFTVANDKHVIRQPEPYPFWHGEDPFVKIPLMRVPFGNNVKALYDQVVPLNLALNELYNLILDGGIAEVWGVRQVRTDYMEDPGQVTDGIPQGMTIAVAEDAPDGAKVVETATTGQVPGEALAVFNLTDRNLNTAALTNDLELGNLPSKQVRATEIQSIDNSKSAMTDDIVMDMEHGIARLLRKCFLTLVQFADNLELAQLQNSLGRREALVLARMSPAERFVLLAQGQVKVSGLSSTLARARNFQKFAALMQIVQGNPMLMRSFLKKYSSEKFLDHLIKTLDLDPTRIERDPEEIEQLPAEMDEIMRLFGLTNQGNVPSPTGEAGIPSEIQQEAQPSQVLQ